jgi:uncharacterized protein
MAIYAIGDLHLSHSQEKPMHIFGPEWNDHAARIESNWNAMVGPDDFVIVIGDISWAMHLKDALPDLEWLSGLTGTKLLIRGNHDYWWSSIGKVRSELPPGLLALQNDHYTWDDWAICGTRGWICPGEDGFDNEHDQKIYLREAHRLQLSLESARKSSSSPIIAALHFPPYNRQAEPSAFTNLLEQYAVEICVFGHIHDPGRDFIHQGVLNGVDYRFAAADGINFTPLKLT